MSCILFHEMSECFLEADGDEGDDKRRHTFIDQLLLLVIILILHLDWINVSVVV